jgi:hypothetical protein
VKGNSYYEVTYESEGNLGVGSTSLLIKQMGTEAQRAGMNCSWLPAKEDEGEVGQTQSLHYHPILSSSPCKAKRM